MTMFVLAFLPKFGCEKKGMIIELSPSLLCSFTG
jgi:hypothetical protein